MLGACYKFGSSTYGRCPWADFQNSLLSFFSVTILLLSLAGLRNWNKYEFDTGRIGIRPVFYRRTESGRKMKLDDIDWRRTCCWPNICKQPKTDMERRNVRRKPWKRLNTKMFCCSRYMERYFWLVNWIILPRRFMALPPFFPPPSAYIHFRLQSVRVFVDKLLFSFGRELELYKYINRISLY